MPHIEDNAAVTGFEEELVRLLVRVQNRELLGIHVGVNVAGAHFLQQFRVGAFRGRGQKSTISGFLQIADASKPRSTASQGGWAASQGRCVQ